MPAGPDFFAVRPSALLVPVSRPDPLPMMDPLTLVLSSLRLTACEHYSTHLTAPWGLDLPKHEGAALHVVLSGHCWLMTAPGAPPIALEAGDLALFPRGDAHVLADEPTTVARQVACHLHAGAHFAAECLHAGGGGAPTDILCSKFSVESPEANPLWTQLPESVVVRGDSGQPVPWLQTTLGLLTAELGSTRLGSEAILTRLLDVILIQALRTWIEARAADHSGWLGALQDRGIGTALGAIHGLPHENWTVATLAERAGLSRTIFAERFQELVGEAPLAYLTRSRMGLAAGLLRSEHAPPLVVVAEKVGYASEAAFCRAFKRIYGESPGRFRRRAEAS